MYRDRGVAVLLVAVSELSEFPASPADHLAGGQEGAAMPCARDQPGGVVDSDDLDGLEHGSEGRMVHGAVTELAFGGEAPAFHLPRV